MAMQAHEIEDLIRLAFPDAKISIEDLRGDGDHYSCMVELSLIHISEPTRLR